MGEKLQPQLRFPGFKEDWKSLKIQNISEVKSGGTPSRINSDFWNGTIPWITTSQVNYKNIFKSDEFITQDAVNNSSAKLFPKNTILIAMYGQGNTRGRVSLLKIEATTNQACAAIIVDKENDYKFIYQVLVGSYSDLRNLSNEGGQKNLSIGIIKEFKLFIPPLPEQQKIADYLSTIDTKINLLGEKKTELSRYKKAMMQKLFSREIRFKDENGKDFPDWEEKRLGEIAQIKTGSSNREDSNLISEYTFFDRSQEIRKSNIFLFDCEAIIIAGEGREFIPKYFEGKFDLHQRTYAIMSYTDSLGIFLFHYINFKRVYFEAHAVGSTVKSLRLPIFEKMPLVLPNLPEQQKIAHFLSAIDESINKVEEQIKQTQAFKKAMLQQMFV